VTKRGKRECFTKTEKGKEAFCDEDASDQGVAGDRRRKGGKASATADQKGKEGGAPSPAFRNWRARPFGKGKESSYLR